MYASFVPTEFSVGNVSRLSHVRCAVDVDGSGRPVCVRWAGQTWTVEAVGFSRRSWLGQTFRHRWQVPTSHGTLELYNRKYALGAPGLTWWWLVIPSAAQTLLKIRLDARGDLVILLE